jgi:hypothetical protein
VFVPPHFAKSSNGMELQYYTTECYVPKLKMDGNEWLDKLFVNTRKPTKDDVIAAFEHPKLEHMKNLYLSELASGKNKCGGGMKLNKNHTITVKIPLQIQCSK